MRKNWMRKMIFNVVTLVLALVIRADGFLPPPCWLASSSTHCRVSAPLMTTHGEQIPHVIVVGAGVGGLSSAARLSKAGCRVTVVEKNGEDGIGGRLNELVFEGGYRFDTGPSLLLLPRTYKKAFADLGYDSEEFFHITRVSPAYKVYFSDGDTIELCDDEDRLCKQIETLEEGGYAKYKEYLHQAQLNLEVGLPNFIEERLDMSRLPEFAWKALSGSFPLENHHAQLSRKFSTPKMRALLSFQDLYVGLSPYNAPAIFSLLQGIELGEGVFYPMGGFAGVSKAMAKVCQELGVQFHFDTSVSEVMVVGEAGRTRAEGVRLTSGQVLEADAVVCNADLPYAEEALLPDSVARNFKAGFKQYNAEYSSSVVAFYFATNKRWPQLAHHTVFLSTDWQGSWDSAFGKTPGGELGESFNFYVAAPARTDPSVCPEGHDAIMVLVPCPSLPDKEGSAVCGGGERNDWVRRAREGVVSALENTAQMKGFADSLVGEEFYAPKTWRDRYNLRRGSVFGLSHGLNQLSVNRPSHRHPTINGLWYCGASTRPGNGVPLVLIGASQVAQDVVRTLRQGNT
ncbi:unnamed protein product [Discosporangium mesarthrocarpum]